MANAACDTSKPTSTEPVEVEEHDALVDALACAGLAEPMTLERMEDAWAATYPVFSLALHPYMDDVQLATAAALAGRSACATTVEDGDTTTARGSCPENALREIAPTGVQIRYDLVVIPAIPA